MKKEKFWKKRRLKKGYVYIVSSSSNIFLTLANRKKKILYQITAGLVRKFLVGNKLISGRNEYKKKFKKHPEVLKNLGRLLALKIQALRIQKIIFIIKVSLRFPIRFILRELYSKVITGYVLQKKIYYKIPHAHNGVRFKRKRRL